MTGNELQRRARALAASSQEAEEPDSRDSNLAPRRLPRGLGNVVVGFGWILLGGSGILMDVGQRPAWLSWVLVSVGTVEACWGAKKSIADRDR
jgi:hypothetical protein